jgi:GNAT superfamily N-acetyltransferase
MTITRTSSDDPDFQQLSQELEDDLKIRDGDQHLFYSELNKIDWIQQVLVVYKNSIPIACGAIRAYNNDTMEIKRMFVQPAHRGQQIATAILAELEKWTEELNCKHCVLETGKNQPEAITFYKKNQYQLIPNFGKYADSENSICFEKKIHA